MRLLSAILLSAMLLGCGELVDRDVAANAARSEGYTNVSVGSRNGVVPAFSGCSKDDAVAFDVEATNVREQRVHLTVCCGWLWKACTIRH